MLTTQCGEETILVNTTASKEKDSFLFRIKPEALTHIFDVYAEFKYTEEINYLEKIFANLPDQLHTDFEKGISQYQIDEFQRRKNYFGANEKPNVINPNFSHILFSFFKNYTIRMLIISSVLSIFISAITSDYLVPLIKGIAIIIGLSLSTIISSISEYQKEKACVKLKNLFEFSKHNTVIRDGLSKSICKSDLVVGDLALIEAGSIVPADSIIISSSQHFAVDEFFLSASNFLKQKRTLSECLIEKKSLLSFWNKNFPPPDDFPSPVLLSGSHVMHGEATILILAVGKKTVFEKLQGNYRRKKHIAQEDEYFQELNTNTPFQSKLKELSKNIGKYAILSSILILIIMLLQFIVTRSLHDNWDNSVDWKKLLDCFIISSTILVLTLPEGITLTAAFTIIYAINEMLKHNNCVRKLEGSEMMAKVTTICTNKTGTLTENEMILTSFWNHKLIIVDTYSKYINLSSYIPEALQNIFLLSIISNCSTNALLGNNVPGSNVERALLKFLQKCRVDRTSIENNFKIIQKIPFHSSEKKTAALIETDNTKILMIKGAADICINKCKYYHEFDNSVNQINNEKIQNIISIIEDLSSEGLKVLCFCYKYILSESKFEEETPDIYSLSNSDFIFLCLFTLKNHLRPDVSSTISKLKSAGISIIMTTGDNLSSARAIAQECGIIDPNSDNEHFCFEGEHFYKMIRGIICSKCKSESCYCPQNNYCVRKFWRKMRVETLGDMMMFRKMRRNLSIIANATPEHKLALMIGLKEQGEIVAVLGNGVNDALVLSKSDIGFCKNESSVDIVKENCSIIIMDDNFKSILKSIVWGRNIYDSVRKFLVFHLTASLSTVLSTIICSVFIGQAILESVQLLWINLIMDCLASLALATENANESSSNIPPLEEKEKIFTPKMIKHIIGQTFFQVVIMCVLVMKGDTFLPEAPDEFDILIQANDKWEYSFKYNTDYFPDILIVRNGRNEQSISEYDYYYDNLNEITPSRHMTVCFNVFVFMQIFNFFNCRKINDDLNIFENIKTNYYFITIVILISVVQVIFITFGGKAIQCYKWNGLNFDQWWISILIGFSGIFWSYILRFIPEDKYIKMFNS